MLFGKKKKMTTTTEEKGYSSGDILEEERIYQEGLTKVLDLIAPSSMEVTSSKLQIGDVFCRTLFVVAFPKTLSIGWLNPIIGMDLTMDISLFIHPVNTATVLKKLRKKVTQVQSEMNIESESGLVRDPILEMAYYNIETLRDQLQEGVERFFKTGLYFNVFGESEEDLEDKCAILESLLNARSIYTKKAFFRSKEGFVSSIPLGIDKLMNGNALNTSPLSTAFPFVSADVTSNKGILYGINRHNNSLILFDRFSMENANMVVFAKSGAGKSYAIKLEILRSLMFETDVIVIDPEDEYKYLTEAVGGAYLNISLNSKSHINPFDLPKQKDATMKDLFRSSVVDLIGLLKLMLGTLTPEEESILEQGIRETYAIRDITEDMMIDDLGMKTFPIMDDLYEILRSMEGAEDLTIRLEKYTKGVFSGFLNHHTNISLDNRLVVFNIRDLEEELRPMAMYVVLSYLWREVRSNLKKRLITVDEAWRMMQHEETANFMYAVAKRIRKYYGGLTTITQDIGDFMTSKYGKPIVNNSSIQLLMKQSQAAIDTIADTFYLTDREKYLLMECDVGEGIFFAGTKRAAIQVVASYNEDKIITTNPAERLELERQKLEEEAGKNFDGEK